jgi:hypothetical protein
MCRCLSGLSAWRAEQRGEREVVVNERRDVGREGMCNSPQSKSLENDLMVWRWEMGEEGDVMREPCGR